MGPSYSTLNRRIPCCKDPKIRYPNFRKLPIVEEATRERAGRERERAKEGQRETGKAKGDKEGSCIVQSFSYQCRYDKDPVTSSL